MTLSILCGLHAAYPFSNQWEFTLPSTTHYNLHLSTVDVAVDSYSNPLKKWPTESRTFNNLFPVACSNAELHCLHYKGNVWQDTHWSSGYLQHCPKQAFIPHCFLAILFALEHPAARGISETILMLDEWLIQTLYICIPRQELAMISKLCEHSPVFVLMRFICAYYHCI